MTEQNDFATANEIVDKLKGKEKANQEKILRWVSEELGLLVHKPTQNQPTQIYSETTKEPEIVNSQKIDIKTFYHSKKPKGDIQSATVIAYYYKFIASLSERKDTINKQIIENAARQAGCKQFVKANQVLVNAKNQGYLDPAGSGEYTINSVGENLVVMTLGERKGSEPIRKDISKEE